MSTTTQGTLRYVKPQDLVPSEDNVRTSMNEEALQELAVSVKQDGVRVPLNVYEEDGVLYIISGHRRREAALIANRDSIPVVVEAKPNDDNMLVHRLTENAQRENLSTVDEARVFAQMKAGGLTQKQIAERTGKSEPHVSQMVRLLVLPNDVLEMITGDRLTVQDALSCRALFKEKGSAEAWAYFQAKNEGEDLFDDAPKVTFRDVQEVSFRARAEKDLDDKIASLPEDQLVEDFASLDEKDQRKVRTASQLGVPTEKIIDHEDFRWMITADDEGLPTLSPSVLDGAKWKREIQKALEDPEKSKAVDKEVAEAITDAAAEAVADRERRAREAFDAAVGQRTALVAADSITKKGERDSLIEAHWLASLTDRDAGRIVSTLGLIPVTHKVAVTETDDDGNEVASLDENGEPRTRSVRDNIATVANEAATGKGGIARLMMLSIFLSDESVVSQLPDFVGSAVKNARLEAVKAVKEEIAAEKAEKERIAGLKEQERAAQKVLRDVQKEQEKLKEAQEALDAKKAAAAAIGAIQEDSSEN